MPASSPVLLPPRGLDESVVGELNKEDVHISAIRTAWTSQWGNRAA